MEFHLRPGVVSIKCHLFHFHVEGVKPQVSVMGKMRLDGRLDSSIRAGIR
jgi:hypothetical protein